MENYQAKKLYFQDAVPSWVDLQWVLLLPVMSFVCPVAPTWLWDGEELYLLAASSALLTPLPVGISTTISPGLSNLCRTLSDI